MRNTIAALGTVLTLGLAAAAPVHAAPFTVSVTATIALSGGSYAGDLDPGVALTANISLSTTEADAFNAITTPSTVPGHEFTSFYEFSNPPYTWDATAPALGGSFNAAVLGIVVNNDIPLTSADTGGLVPDGTYDFIELLGSTTVDVCPPGDTCPPDAFTPGSGEEWTLAILADSTWFTDGSVIPDFLPAVFNPILVGADFDEFGNEVGFVLATIDTFETTLPIQEATEIAAPGTVGLMGLICVVASRLGRRRRG